MAGREAEESNTAQYTRVQELNVLESLFHLNLIEYPPEICPIASAYANYVGLLRGLKHHSNFAFACGAPQNYGNPWLSAVCYLNMTARPAALRAALGACGVPVQCSERLDFTDILYALQLCGPADVEDLAACVAVLRLCQRVRHITEARPAILLFLYHAAHHLQESLCRFQIGVGLAPLEQVRPNVPQHTPTFIPHACSTTCATLRGVLERISIPHVVVLRGWYGRAAASFNGREEYAAEAKAPGTT
ncbi:ORF124 [Ranid herpesvirus 1]|uniref:ORF124 n=1 Tax=Ranid herpesvirus 1 TaxID=85655 RepID=Q14VK6_9VIRU|nr:ORF124 [Ranid herpesvirus 1]ABG25785.1 ORF124 [Ranid herpesvirus 1]